MSMCCLLTVYKRQFCTFIFAVLLFILLGLKTYGICRVHRHTRLFVKFRLHTNFVTYLFTLLFIGFQEKVMDLFVVRASYG